MMGFIFQVLIMSVGVFLAAKILPGVKCKSIGTALVVALVYSLINATVGPVLRFFAIPFTILTLGLMLLVINTFLLYVTDKLIEDFEIDTLTMTFVTSVFISVVSGTLNWLL